jgi:hypothetical protein
VATRSIRHGNLIGSGVDWITASAQATSTGHSLEILGRWLVNDERRLGNDEREWRSHGYEGISSGSASVGVGDAGTVLRVSGYRASEVCRDIVSIADNVSRIDLQSTVRFSRDIHALAREHAGELRRVQSQRAKQLHTRLERTFGRGDTLYVGSRTSNYYGRVYDKARESGEQEYVRCWRYEVECKGDGARQAVTLATKTEGAAEAIAAGVYRWYAERGVQPRYEPWRNDGLTMVGRPETDDERRLTWLATQVAPMISRLKVRYGKEALIAYLFDGGARPREELLVERSLADRADISP